MRVGKLQPCPDMKPHPTMAPTVVADLRSASSKMMLADFPPSSSTTGFIDSAHDCRMRVAVAGPPVKLTFFTNGCLTSASPADASPGSMLTTPGGNPACSTRSMKYSPVNGVSSDGLTTTVLPAARIAGTFMLSEKIGAFHVMIAAITP